MTAVSGWQHGWGDWRRWGSGRWAAIALALLVLSGGVVAFVTSADQVGSGRGDDASSEEATSQVAEDADRRAGGDQMESAGGSVATAGALGAPTASGASDVAAMSAPQPVSLVPGASP